MSRFRDSYISNNLLIQPLLCTKTCRITKQEACCLTPANTEHTALLRATLLNKQCTYCTHHSPVTTSLHPRGSCMLLYAPTYTQHNLTCCVMHGGFPDVQSVQSRGREKILCTSLCSAVRLYMCCPQQEKHDTIKCNSPIDSEVDMFFMLNKKKIILMFI